MRGRCAHVFARARFTSLWHRFKAKLSDCYLPLRSDGRFWRSERSSMGDSSRVKTCKSCLSS